jgi:aminoglycoside phosphotransferase (APT) family kinase protein
MTIRGKPPADVSIDGRVVSSLLQEQRPDLAHLDVREIGEGWDNTLFRLGETLCVRLPRRAASAALVEHEQRWLPQLSVHLPLPVPVPVHAGRPGCGFPWSWSIVPWFSGESALTTPPAEPHAVTATLPVFLRALHRLAPIDAPRNPWRGVPLAARTTWLHEHLQRLEGHVDRAGILALWEHVAAAPAWPEPPVWIHGDLHPGNLVIHETRLAAVIDFGDLTAGDPATDLAVFWMFPMSPSARADPLTVIRQTLDEYDRHVWRRARGWALALGLAQLAGSPDDSAMAVSARHIIAAALAGGD